MSATNRGNVRRPNDHYETPAWCVRRLLERIDLPVGYWIEPCSGNGAIIRAVNAHLDTTGAKVDWTAVDIRPEINEHLSDVDTLLAGIDFLNRDLAGCEYDVAITNPPYSLAMEFIDHSLELADHVAMLLRLNFISSAKRSAFFRREMPDVYVLPNRPSFTGGGTDSTEYAWAVWTPERGRRHGSIEILEDTHTDERRI